MRTSRPLALTGILAALLPLGAHAQGSAPPVFAQPYQYADAQGPGTLTFTALSSENTRLRFGPIAVVLVQNNVRFTGSGVYHAFADDGVDLPPFTLVAFTLRDRLGRAFFFQGSIAPVNGFTGEGTYWRVDAPARTFAWRVQTLPPAVATAVENSAPLLTEGWARNLSSEAIGGVYYGAFNREREPRNTATWSGTLPAAGNYRVEVFIPRQPARGVAPRTGRARYAISVAGAEQPVVQQIDQAVTFSQWVPLGTFAFTESYRILLTDETGEPTNSRSVVANAVRLIPVPASP